MPTRTSLARWLLTLCLAASLLFGALGASLSQVQASPQAQATSCYGGTITQWTFTGDTISPSWGSGVLNEFGVDAPTFPASSANPPAVSYDNWADDSSSVNPAEYIELKISTEGRNSITLTFTASRTSTGPSAFELRYTIDNGATYNALPLPLNAPRIVTTEELTYVYNLSSINDINNAADVGFGIFAYSASGSTGTLRLDNITFTGSCLIPGPSPTPTITPTPSPTRSVVINEVAWMGTLASPSHEWIELYNPPGGVGDIDLSNWSVNASDGSPSIVIPSGNTIIDGGYFLLKSGNIFSADVTTASYQYSGSLFSDAGETLVLRDASNTTIDTANANGGAWPAGTLTTASNHGTMERTSTTAPDADSFWLTNVDSATWTKHDIAGNLIHGTPGGSNSFTFNDTIAPTVTVEQAAGQIDPTASLPISFTVTFSEPINVATFTTSDITQTGTATGITWSITPDPSFPTTKFTLSATVSGFGTLIPSIAANLVTDPTGNNNMASTSTDNNVTFVLPPQIAIGSVVINEVAWMGTAATGDDEWIELYNTTTSSINLTGWRIRRSTGAGEIVLGGTIGPRAYFLVERTDDNTVKDIAADWIATWTLLSPNGEILLLCSPYNVSSNTCNTNSQSHPVDEVNRNGGVWPAGSSSTFGSMERKYFQSDQDTDWFTHTGGNPRWGHDANWDGFNATSNQIKGTPKHPNWALNVTATPRATFTPTRTPTPLPQPTPILVLNEFLARPGHDFNNDGLVNNFDEFIEVINAGTVNVTLSNYKLDDEQDLGSAPFALPAITLKPGEIMVFYASQTGISLSDAGDTVRLLKASNNSVADAYTYPIVKSLDISYCRLTDGYGDWVPRCFPTPGLPNALAGTLPPLPGAPSGSACLLPDTTPQEFVQAECIDTGLNMWNAAYWDLPDEGGDVSFSEDFNKWTVIYQ